MVYFYLLVYDLSTSYFEKRMFFHVVISTNFAKPDVVTWILPLTLSKPSRAPDQMHVRWTSVYRGTDIICRLSWPRRSEAELTAFRRDRDAARCLRIPSWTSDLCRPSPGAFSPLRCAAIETSDSSSRFYVIWSAKFDRPFWERRSKPIMGISADMDRRRSDRSIPSFFPIFWEFFLIRCEVKGQGCRMCTDCKAHL